MSNTTTTTTTTTGKGVDVGALAGAIHTEVARRFSTVLVAGLDSLEDDGRGLNQLQKTSIVEWGLELFDGLERTVAELAIRELEHAEQPYWGLPDSLSDLQRS
jgi:hypothetical protein